MGDSVEIADAYVAIHAQMPGVEKDIAKSLGGADGAFEGAGKRGGGLFGKAAGASLIGNLGADAIQSAVSGITSYLGDSVTAYKDAEAAQVQLSDAYARFPAVSDVSLQSLRDLNSELMNKTRFDDDALASGQAILAQYGLTGTQLQQLTPLLTDYAAKTGKDAVSAAEDLGKAMLGQGRALKGVGIDFQDAGSVAGNFDQVMSGLSAQVGGFAETDAASAVGISERMANQFGEVQESIGSMLMPAIMALSSFMLSSFIPAIQGVTQFFAENQQLIPVLAAALLVVLSPAIWAAVTAVWAFTAALLANPITWIVIAVAALIAAIVLLILNWETVVAVVTDIWGGFIGWITGVIDGFVGWWNGVWAAVGAWLTDVWNNAVAVVQAVLLAYVGWVLGIVGGFLGWWNGIWSAVGSFFTNLWNSAVSVARGILQAYIAFVMGAVSAVVGWWNGIWGTVGDVIRNVFGGIGSFVSGVFDNIVGGIRRAINSIISIINNGISGLNGVLGVVGGALGVNVSLPSIPRLAEGAIVSARPGGIMANIGEGRYDEAVLPLSPSVLGALGGGGSGSGKTVKQYIYPQQDDPTIQAREWAREAEREFASA